jgi:hypothetical protein
MASFTALAALALLAGCGSSTNAISAPNASRLHGDVQRIRSAAAAGNVQLAHAAVRALRGDIGRLAAQGQLAASDAQLLMTEAGQANGRISVEVKPPSSPPATPQPSSIQPSTPSAGNSNGPKPGPKPGPGGPGPGPGHGPGHGHGGGDGGN